MSKVFPLGQALAELREADDYPRPFGVVEAARKRTGGDRQQRPEAGMRPIRDPMASPDQMQAGEATPAPARRFARESVKTTIYLSEKKLTLGNILKIVNDFEREHFVVEVDWLRDSQDVPYGLLITVTSR